MSTKTKKPKHQWTVEQVVQVHRKRGHRLVQSQARLTDTLIESAT